MLTWLTAGLALLGTASGLGVDVARAPVVQMADAGARCAVSGPSGDGPLRTDSFGRRPTVIAVRPGELPDVIPAALDAYLKEQGAVLGERRENGSVSVKAGWVRDRRATGVLEVTGKRTDPSGGRFSADVNRLYGGKKFARVVPSQLRMSGPGCWRIRARAGSARVTYVVRVRYPSPGEL